MKSAAPKRKPRTNEAYDDGMVAYHANISVAANPWPVFDPKYQQWAMGWMDQHRATLTLSGGKGKGRPGEKI